jgi:hypothetical protein
VPFSVDVPYESQERPCKAFTFVLSGSVHWLLRVDQKQATMGHAKTSPVITQPECKTTCCESSTMYVKYDIETQ